MQIQKIHLLISKNNPKTNNLNHLSFNKEPVQPDSLVPSISAPVKTHENNNPKAGILASLSTGAEKPEPSILATTLSPSAIQKNKEINEYLSAFKKELKSMQNTARAHQKQCLGILKKAQKFGYKGTIDCDDYNITFGVIDPETNKPSAINIWENGTLVQQYTIISLKPFKFEVYDCECKNLLVEEFKICDGKLTQYSAVRPKEDTAEIIIPQQDGFYKAEGSISKEGTYVSSNCCMVVKKEMTYSANGCSYYSEHKDGTKDVYVLKNKNGIWKPF